MELPCLALLVFFGTLLVLPQASVGSTRYYTFNVCAFFFGEKDVVQFHIYRALASVLSTAKF